LKERKEDGKRKKGNKIRRESKNKDSNKLSSSRKE
jgi:hypothetical protein